MNYQKIWLYKPLYTKLPAKITDTMKHHYCDIKIALLENVGISI